MTTPLPIEPDDLPTLTIARSLVIDVPFGEAGETILGLQFGSAPPVGANLRIPRKGTYRFTIEFERHS